jgi:cbb3-type cytochrome oxidase subunit 3
MIGEDFFGTIFFGIISLAFWIPALKKTPRKTPEEKQ